MAAFTKYNFFVDEMAKGGHNLATAVFKCALTNTAPTPLTEDMVGPPYDADGTYGWAKLMTTS